MRIEINHARAARVAAIAAIALVPAAAHADDPFASAAQTITQATDSATNAAQKILLTAAVLALMVGLAPMLWGQVKVKWIVSSLCACVLFGLAHTAVQAFSVGG